ncbi:PaaD-like zinc ribbon domain-containing protein [Calidifontibacillus erzurumensis]|uniref:PaaD zinc beta ribbon domain-containing protein n=1 Tax=Calidifontibacillus erzurumensis TaxID=2741433 RepID=A0A8J8KAD9_9BACI|nr:hypothetical protein [Calidifontibacillus erzurumensis]NSL50542.1 hypothetical protein [Calidifontibacillus erzurumensis]
MRKKNDKPFCAFCNSENVELIAPFGTAQLVRQFHCKDCQSVFEYLRWRTEDTFEHVENSKQYIRNA